MSPSPGSPQPRGCRLQGRQSEQALRGLHDARPARHPQGSPRALLRHRLPSPRPPHRSAAHGRLPACCDPRAWRLPRQQRRRLLAAAETAHRPPATHRERRRAIRQALPVARPARGQPALRQSLARSHGGVLPLELSQQQSGRSRRPAHQPPAHTGGPAAQARCR